MEIMKSLARLVWTLQNNIDLPTKNAGSQISLTKLINFLLPNNSGISSQTNRFERVTR